MRARPGFSGGPAPRCAPSRYTTVLRRSTGSWGCDPSSATDGRAGVTGTAGRLTCPRMTPTSRGAPCHPASKAMATMSRPARATVIGSEPHHQSGGRVAHLMHATAVAPVLLPSAAQFDVARDAVPEHALDAIDLRFPGLRRLEFECSVAGPEQQAFDADAELPARPGPVAQLDEPAVRPDRPIRFVREHDRQLKGAVQPLGADDPVLESRLAVHTEHALRSGR